MLRNVFFLWPLQVANHLQWAGPLLARVAIGYVFLRTGWLKLANLEYFTQAFVEWGIPAPEMMAPFVAGLECFGGALLLLGLLTRISAGGLAVTMLVAIASARWHEVDSLHTLLSFEEVAYGVIFVWLAIAGAGRASLDALIERRTV